MNRICVEVTAGDIAGGARNHVRSCPVALAVRRCIPGAAAIFVGDRHISWRDSGSAPWRARLPEDAAEFVRRFDRDLPVTPVAFEVEPDSEPIRPSGGTQDKAVAGE